MMKYLIFFILSLVMVTACNNKKGSGNIITQNRETGSFNGVSAGSAFEVEIKTGSSTEVIVESDDNLMKYIETKVENGVLKIRSRETNIIRGHLKVYVTSPNIDFIKGSGAATLKTMNEVKNADKITIDASGASTVIANVDAPNIYADASGASNIELIGRTRDYKAEASGSSNIKSGKLQSEHTVVDASGSSSIHTYGSVNISAKASGASSVYYSGAGVLKSTISGAASIKQEN